MQKSLYAVLLTGLLFTRPTNAQAQTRPRQATPVLTKPADATVAPPVSTSKADMLVRRDGTQLEVLVTEITDKEIVYKRANNPTGPSFRAQKADFSFIKYGNTDEIERFLPVAQPAPPPQPVPQSVQETGYQPRPMTQPAAIPQGIRFGFKAGIQSASLSLSGSGLTGYSAKGIVGFQGGVLATIPVSSGIQLRPQVLYSSKGCNLSKGANNADITIAYIEVPVDLLFRVPTSSGALLLGGGGYVASAMSGKFGTTDAKIGSTAADDITPLDFGLRFAGWYDLPAGLTLNAFYNLGLADINPDASQLSTLKNTTFGVGIGYFLSTK
ncbi:porin family protein [Fibrella forsythiae]|uniref:PorT family protein n=1 Tax=Fibrella forsythiae TaxID=2817061 RepID=A0ABS3JG50_9BACT|nr:porin family protein [Fibrella forsythiae]MBO0948984.1 PorT family protein [Fibrella forsythiae]